MLTTSISPPPHVLAYTATERFGTQLASARRQRAAIAPAPPHLAELTALAELRGPLWDDAIARLGAALVEALGVTCALEDLHHALPDFSPSEAGHAAVMASKQALLRPLADAERAAAFVAAYDDVVCHVLAPSLGAPSLRYACVPTLRVQPPSTSRATIRPHCDGMYGLQAGSINVWLPLTPVSATSALWVEEEDGGARARAGDGGFPYHALTRPTRFDGRSLIHFTVPNHSDRTRVSLDLRCVPGHLYDANARLSRLGYFSLAERATGGGAWAKAAAGRVSKLHGLPHVAEPRVDE